MGKRKETRVQGEKTNRKKPGGRRELKMSQEKRNIKPVTWLEMMPFKIQTRSGFWGGDSWGELRNVTGGWGFPSKFSLPLSSSSEEEDWPWS